MKEVIILFIIGMLFMAHAISIGQNKREEAFASTQELLLQEKVTE